MSMISYTTKMSSYVTIRGFCKRDFNVRQYMLRFSSRLNLSKDKLKYKW